MSHMALLLIRVGDRTILMKDILINSKLIQSTFGKFLRSFSSMKFQISKINKSIMPLFNKSNMNAIFTKSRVLFIILFFSVISSFSQATGDYRSAGTGTWATLGTWERYNGSTWVTPTGVQGTPTNASGVITIQSPHIVTVAASVSTDQTTINTGGQITVSSGVTLTVANGTGTDITNNGTLSVDGTISSSGLITNSATMNVNAGGTYTHNQNGGVIPTATWSTTSTCNITGLTGTDPTGDGQAFGNLTYNCAGMTGNINMAGSGLSISGDFQVLNTGSGSLRSSQTPLTVTGNCTIGDNFRLASNTSRTLTVNGNFILTGGTFDISGGTGIGTLEVGGDFTLTAGTLTESNTGSGDIDFIKTGTQIYTSGSTVSNVVNFTVNSGSTLQMAAAGTIVSGGGSFTLSSGATLGIKSTVGITTTGATGNIQVTGTRTYTTGASYIYNGSANQAVGNGLTQNTPANLTITNPGFTVSLGANTTISGILTVNVGSTLSMTTYNLLTPTAVDMVSGSNTSASITGTTGTLTLGGDITVTYSGAGSSGAIISSIVALGAANRTFNIATGTSNDLSINGVISGATNINKSGSGRLLLGGTNIYTGTTTVSVGTIKLNNTSALGTNAGGTIVSTGAELDLFGITLSASEPLTLNGTGIADGALLNTSNTAATYNGAITLASSSQIDAGAGNIILGTSGIVGGFNLTKSGGFNLSLGNSTSALGAVTVSAGTLTAPGTINMSGDFTNDGTFSAGIGTINLNSASAQSITGGTATTFNNLTLSGGGAKTLSTPATVDGVLTFTSGILTTSSTILLSITANGTVASVSATSFVNGPVNKTGGSAFVFPVGKTGTGYQAIGISASGTSTDAFTAEYIRSSAIALSAVHKSPITMVSDCEYWNLTPTNGTPTVDVSLYGNTASGCGTATGANYFTGSSAPLANLRVIHYNGTTWENATSGSTSVSGTSPNVIVTAAAVSNFSPFTFGSINLSPLPVKLVAFTAIADNNNSLLSWTTASELNNDRFEIERSIDGILFTTVGEVKGAGNSTSILNYQFIDSRVSELSTKQVYYRLKQVDFDGTFDYSNIVLVNFNKINAVTIQNIQPNPFGDKLTVSYSLPTTGLVTISMVDLQGRVLITTESNANKGFNTANFNTENIATGMYFITISHQGMTSNYKMLVKK